jgi:alpha-1,3-rhamnosyl/mannosyltransferase
LGSVSSIIAISEFTKADLVEWLGIPREKITVVPLGVDTRMFKPMQGSAGYLQDRFALEGDYILHVGTLENRKNLLPLLDAFSQVRKRHPHVRLVLAGNPGKGCEHVQEKIHKLGLEKAILRLGYLDGDQDLPHLYSGAKAFIFPSLYEGFGLPVLEALACGTPVAASNCTAIPEVAGDAALLFDPREPDDIADKVLRLLEDSGLVLALREKSFARVRSFTWTETAKQTLRIYKNCGESR